MSPRTGEQNQRIRDERREQILQAALAVFARKGWSAAKISDVALESGYSHGLVYHYFKSKDEIFVELARQALEMSIAIFMQGALMPGTPWEKLKAMTETIIPNAYRGTSPYYFLIMIQAYTSEAVPQEVKNIVQELGPRFTESLIPIITEGQKIGEVAVGDPLKMATAYFAMIQGLAIAQIQGGDEIALPNPEIVLRLFSVNSSKRLTENTEAETNETMFHPASPIPLRLAYRSISQEKGKPDVKYIDEIETTTLDGQDFFRIKVSRGKDDEMTALVQPDWHPIWVETREKGAVPLKIVYGEGLATFERFGKSAKHVKIHGDSYDSNTLFHFLRGYPFGTTKKVTFNMVMDGKGGSPLGAFKMSVQAVDREELQTPAGTFGCYKLEMGVAGIASAFASKFKSHFWFTAQAPHFLVRYEDNAGRLTELIEIK